MLTTEDEAKAKVCCGGSGCGTVRTYDDGTYRVHCLGSACMAWRWHAWTEYVPDPETPNHFTANVRVSDTHGFCGKAGMPKGYAHPTE